VQPGRHNDTITLLAVGAVVERKGYDVLVAALAKLTHLQWRLVSPATAAAVRKHWPGSRATLRASRPR